MSESKRLFFDQVFCHYRYLELLGWSKAEIINHPTSQWAMRRILTEISDATVNIHITTRFEYSKIYLEPYVLYDKFYRDDCQLAKNYYPEYSISEPVDCAGLLKTSWDDIDWSKTNYDEFAALQDAYRRTDLLYVDFWRKQDVFMYNPRSNSADQYFYNDVYNGVDFYSPEANTTRLSDTPNDESIFNMNTRKCTAAPEGWFDWIYKISKEWKESGVEDLYPIIPLNELSGILVLIFVTILYLFLSIFKRWLISPATRDKIIISLLNRWKKWKKYHPKKPEAWFNKGAARWWARFYRREKTSDPRYRVTIDYITNGCGYVSLRGQTWAVINKYISTKIHNLFNYLSRNILSKFPFLRRCVQFVNIFAISFKTYVNFNFVYLLKCFLVWISLAAGFSALYCGIRKLVQTDTKTYETLLRWNAKLASNVLKVVGWHNFVKAYKPYILTSHFERPWYKCTHIYIHNSLMFIIYTLDRMSKWWISRYIALLSRELTLLGLWCWRKLLGWAYSPNDVPSIGRIKDYRDTKLYKGFIIAHKRTVKIWARYVFKVNAKERKRIFPGDLNSRLRRLNLNWERSRYDFNLMPALIQASIVGIIYGSYFYCGGYSLSELFDLVRPYFHLTHIYLETAAEEATRLDWYCYLEHIRQLFDIKVPSNWGFKPALRCPWDRDVFAYWDRNWELWQFIEHQRYSNYVDFPDGMPELKVRVKINWGEWK